MGAWEGEIPDEKIWQVVTFLSHLRNLPPDVEADWTQPPVETESVNNYSEADNRP